MIESEQSWHANSSSCNVSCTQSHYPSFLERTLPHRNCQWNYLNSCCCSLYFITRFRHTQKTPSSRLLVRWTILQQTALPKPRLLQRRSLQCQIQCVLWWLLKTPRPGAILERDLLQIPELRSQGLVLLPWCCVQQKGVQDPRLLQRPAI